MAADTEEWDRVRDALQHAEQQLQTVEHDPQCDFLRVAINRWVHALAHPVFVESLGARESENGRETRARLRSITGAVARIVPRVAQGFTGADGEQLYADQLLELGSSANGLLEQAAGDLLAHWRRAEVFTGDGSPIATARMDLEMFMEHIKIARGAEDAIRETRVWVERARAAALAQEASAANQIESEKLQRSLTSGAASEKLATHFDEYAKNENAIANRFRFWTITMIVLTGIIAIVSLLLPHDKDDLVPVITRIIAVLGASALSTYLGRQAAHHRKQATWARSIEIQLSSFEAFINRVADETTANGIFAMFAQRVLGSPPEIKTSTPGPADTTNALLAQIITQLR